MRLMFAFMTLFLFTSLHSSAAAAHTCLPSTFEKQFDHSPMVFIGIPEKRIRYATYLRVINLYKAPAEVSRDTKMVLMQSLAPGRHTSAEVIFKLGKEYLVFAYGLKTQSDGFVSGYTGNCVTRLTVDERIKELREEKDKPSPPTHDTTVFTGEVKKIGQTEIMVSREKLHHTILQVGVLEPLKNSQGLAVSDNALLYGRCNKAFHIGQKYLFYTARINEYDSNKPEGFAGPAYHLHCDFVEGQNDLSEKDILEKLSQRSSKGSE